MSGVSLSSELRVDFVCFCEGDGCLTTSGVLLILMNESLLQSLLLIKYQSRTTSFLVKNLESKLQKYFCCKSKEVSHFVRASRS